MLAYLIALLFVISVEGINGTVFFFHFYSAAASACQPAFIFHLKQLGLYKNMEWRTSDLTRNFKNKSIRLSFMHRPEVHFLCA